MMLGYSCAVLLGGSIEARALEPIATEPAIEEPAIEEPAVQALVLAGPLLASMAESIVWARGEREVRR